MQVVGRLCEGCGDAVTALGDADGCGSCDVVVCARCLKGTERCPSCQRLFDDMRDVAPRAERRGDAALDRGRRQVIAIGVTLVGAAGLALVLGGAPVGGSLMHIAVIGLLLMQLFRGRAWARWILVALSGLAAAGNGYQGVSHAGGEGPWVLSLAFASIYAWSALVLALSASVSRYLRTQRMRNP